MIGPDNLLFAVDYPFEDNKEAMQMLEKLDFSPEDEKKLFQTKAERFFGI